jgi:endoglucanase Acf2
MTRREIHLCKPLLLAFALAGLATHLPLQAATVGSGSYRDGLPASNPADGGWRGPSQVMSWGPGGVPNYGPAVPKFKAGVAPVSSKWWSGLGWHYWGTQASGLNSVPSYAHPLAFMATPAGVGLWQADQPSIKRLNAGNPSWVAGTPVDGMEYVNGGYESSQFFHFYDQDLVAGLEGLSSGDPLVAGYSDWAVTAEWSGSAGTLQVTSASGSPYLFFKRTSGQANAKVEITGGLTVFSVNGNVLGLSVSKAAADYRPGTTHHYLLVAPTGVNWVQNGSVFTAALGTKGYFTVAALPDTSAATVNEYAQLAHNHITDTRLTWAYDEATAQLTSTYTIATQNPDNGSTNQPTLTAVFPHQWKGNLNNPVNTGHGYASPRGRMKVVKGNYSSRMRFNGLLPSLPVAPADVGRLNGYVNEIANDINKIWQAPPEGTKDDAYWSGRAVGRVASLVAIAAQTGNTAARDKLLGELKAKLQDWLTYSPGEANKHWAYDPTWRSLCPIYDMHYACRDLSDHHFINGYFVRAAAIVALVDPAGASWAQAWGPMVNQLIKDPMNWDRADAQYPFLRHYSPIEGHTWASGISFGDGLNEESSSEGMNFATGAALWGMATGNKAVRDLALMYYVNQTRAIEEYWYDVDQTNHPADYKPQNVGIVWGSGQKYGTWWTPEPRAIHGINILPITSGSLYLGRRADQVIRQLDATEAYEAKYRNLPSPPAPGFKPLMGPLEWSDLFWAYRAHADAAGALASFNANPSAPPEWGQSKADIYQYISALNTLGRLDTTVTADVPSYNVFNKGGVKSYVAYNPGSTPLCVRFSDGRSMSVAARQTVVNGTACSSGDTTPPSVPGGLAVSSVTSSSVTLTWNAATDTGGSGLAGYDLLRGGVKVASPSGTSATDSGLAPGSSHTYTVKARDGAGNLSAASAPVTATTSQNPSTVPARSTLQAESYSAAEPRITRTVGGTAVGTTVDGTWIKLSSIDFGATSPVDFVLNLASGLAGSGSITLYKDSIAAANQIATLGVGNTGGWTSFRQVAMNLSTPVTGVHDLYLQFRTPYADPNGLVNLDWLQFR